MTRAEVVETLKGCWMQYGADLLIDVNGRFDELKTFTGLQLQGGLLSELWLDSDPEHYEFFRSLCIAPTAAEDRKAGWAEWVSIKAEAFPADQIYGS